MLTLSFFENDFQFLLFYFICFLVNWTFDSAKRRYDRCFTKKCFGDSVTRDRLCEKVVVVFRDSCKLQACALILAFFVFISGESIVKVKMLTRFEIIEIVFATAWRVWNKTWKKAEGEHFCCQCSVVCWQHSQKQI